MKIPIIHSLMNVQEQLEDLTFQNVKRTENYTILLYETMQKILNLIKIFLIKKRLFNYESN